MERIAAVFPGRLSRRAYALYWLLPCTIIQIPIALLPEQPPVLETILATASIALLVIDLPLGIRRFHDTGLSGGWFILFGYPLGVRLVALAVVYTTYNSLQLLYAPAPAPLVQTIALLLVLLLGAASAGWSFFRLVVRPGDLGPNRFGENPLRTPATSAAAA